jgi:hypothetical protein
MVFKPDYCIKTTNPKEDDIEYAQEFLRPLSYPVPVSLLKLRPNMRLVETDDSIIARVQWAHEMVKR